MKMIGVLFEKNLSMKKTPKFPEVAEVISFMAANDQEAEAKNRQDPKNPDMTVFKVNTEKLKTIVASIGWPTISKGGVKASHHAWLIVQHSDHDPGFQLECLFRMKAERPSEVKRPDIAYLEDRIGFNIFGYQTYGTQLIKIDKRYVPKPIDDPAHVDRRRAKMGLGTLRSGIRAMYRAHPMKNGA